MLNRTQVFDTVEKLPDQFPVDQLILINKIEIGLTQSLSGNVNSKEQTKQKLSKWLK